MAVSVVGLSFNIISWWYMLPLALGTSANTRVANALGAGNASEARNVVRTALLMGLGMQVLLACTLYALREKVVLIFTRDRAVMQGVDDIMPVVALCVVGDGMVAILGSVLRGAGRQVSSKDDTYMRTYAHRGHA